MAGTRWRRRLAGCPAVAVVFLVALPLYAGESPVDFTRQVRPLLSDRCFACHGPDAEARESDLRLDVRDDAVDYGAIVPGHKHVAELVTVHGLVGDWSIFRPKDVFGR